MRNEEPREEESKEQWCFVMRREKRGKVRMKRVALPFREKAFENPATHLLIDFLGGAAGGLLPVVLAVLLVPGIVLRHLGAERAPGESAVRVEPLRPLGEAEAMPLRSLPEGMMPLGVSGEGEEEVAVSDMMVAKTPDGGSVIMMRVRGGAGPHISFPREEKEEGWTESMEEVNRHFVLRRAPDAEEEAAEE